MSTLSLTLTDYVDATRWRWVLSDERGRFLADHEVHLDPAAREHDGFCSPGAYLDYHAPIATQEEQLAKLGAWIGEHVFGGLRDALWQQRSPPASPVQVAIPREAAELLLRPFELACFADGTGLCQGGLRFIYHLQDGEEGARSARSKATGEALRLLAVFSLPAEANPLNLRRERVGLQRLVRGLTQARGLAVELRVLQYGATRETLKEALQEGEGWDVVHLSGHGIRGALLLEDDRGEKDVVSADELGDLLEPAGARLQLLLLDACYSGAGHAAARAQLGLDREPTREQDGAGSPPPETVQTTLPSLAQDLAGRLDCAALAMRYPVGDGFATDLMLSLYDKLLDKGQPLPGALHLALEEALEKPDLPRPPLSPVTPILVGPRAAGLRLAPPERGAQSFVLPRTGLGIAFPAEPARFVGRLLPMLRATRALARGSDARGVLFHGMPGAGKTACALELAYRHAEGRFQGYVWYKAPETGSDVASELFNVLFEVERQLGEPNLGLTTALDDPERFRAFTLPRLRDLLQRNSLLLVLDNLETLLTDSDHWRDPLWKDLVEVLFDHTGLSRVVLTSRRLPAGLGGRAVQVESIHALSLAESVLLARELPHLQLLFHDEEGVELLRQTLRVVQGHPKLLELADGLAADREALADRVAAAAGELADRADTLDAFFSAGGPREGETRQDAAGFVRALHDWTGQVAAGLSPTAGLLLAFLSRLEPEDRQRQIAEIVWPHFLDRLDDDPAAAAARSEPEGGLEPALAALEASGLVGVARPALDPAQAEALASQAGEASLDPAGLPDLLAEMAAGAATYAVHPGVAEAARAAADPSVLEAVDLELGDFHGAMFQQGLAREMEGGGEMVVDSARRAAPYLLRRARWEEAGRLLERMLQWDPSPASLAFALPLLRRVVAATIGTEIEMEAAGALASALGRAGQVAEAEAIDRDRIQKCVARGNYRLASVAAGQLCNLLMDGGRLGEALAVAEENASYTQQAGLGPWTQLADEAMRLQVLNAMGRCEEVLAAAEDLQEQMETLPLESEGKETANPWNVRETLLQVSCKAAIYLERWEAALALNAESVKLKQARGVSALELAYVRFNDYSPLLSLGRIAQARELLLDCRAVYEAERDVTLLGSVYGALADLEAASGAPAAAVRFEQAALAYKYRAGTPEDCAVSHCNLATYLERQGGAPAAVLAHQLADALICYQTRSGTLVTTLRNLALSDLPDAPPSFADVVAEVERVEGVRFRALFERLPRTAPDGDAALAAVWQLVAEERTRRDEREQQRQAALAALPPAVRAAFDLEGKAFSAALKAALAALPEEEAAAAVQRMQEAGLISVPTGPDMAQVLRQFEPLLRDIAAAVGEESLRAQIEPVLARMEEDGWMLRDAARRLWAGERDGDALTAGIDPNSAQLVRRVLELLKSS